MKYKIKILYQKKKFLEKQFVNNKNEIINKEKNEESQIIFYYKITNIKNNSLSSIKNQHIKKSFRRIQESQKYNRMK